jgi:hypothetical protein
MTAKQHGTSHPHSTFVCAEQGRGAAACQAGRRAEGGGPAPPAGPGRGVFWHAAPAVPVVSGLASCCLVGLAGFGIHFCRIYNCRRAPRMPLPAPATPRTRRMASNPTWIPWSTTCAPGYAPVHSCMPQLHASPREQSGARLPIPCAQASGSSGCSTGCWPHPYMTMAASWC